jgi:hypothetical protein
MDPSSKLREASGLLRRKFLIDEKVKRFETFYVKSFYYSYLLNAADCIYEGSCSVNLVSLHAVFALGTLFSIVQVLSFSNSCNRCYFHPRVFILYFVCVATSH